MTIDCDNLGSVGCMSSEYRVWKAETMSKQTSHKEGVQRTGLWQEFKDVKFEENVKDKNEYTVELAPGWR